MNKYTVTYAKLDADEAEIVTGVEAVDEFQAVAVVCQRTQSMMWPPEIDQCLWTVTLEAP